MRSAIRTLVTAVMVGALLTVTGNTARAEGSCGHFDRDTGDYVACASDEGHTGGPGAESTSNESGDAAEGPCTRVRFSPLPADSRVWRRYLPPEADPADYMLRISGCGVDGRAPIVTVVPRGSATPPDPQVVASQAIARLPVPLPDIGIGPNIDKVAVNVPIWLWMSNPDPVSASATDRSVTVTASASLASVTWSMGEPSAPPVTCDGPGVAPQPGADLWDPPCGYTYRLRSLPQRTGGSGTWAVTAEATWAITWQSNTGESGSDTVTTTSTMPVSVGEYRTVIVANG